MVSTINDNQFKLICQEIFSVPTVSLPVEIVGDAPTPLREVIRKQNIRGLGVPLHNIYLGVDGKIWFKEDE